MSEIPLSFAKDEVRRFFLKVRNLRDRVLFDLIYRHGLRRGEAARLRVEDIDLREMTIRIQRLKGSRSGVYRLHPTSVRLLRAYSRQRSIDNPFLFPGRLPGTHICAQTIYHACRKYARAAKTIRSNPHAFRHACGITLLDSGLDLVDVADHLGHRSLSTAMRYAAVSSKRRNDNFERIVNSREFASTV
jgi:integrase